MITHYTLLKDGWKIQKYTCSLCGRTSKNKELICDVDEYCEYGEAKLK